jgi:hypothetical protein
MLINDKLPTLRLPPVQALTNIFIYEDLINLITIMHSLPFSSLPFPSLLFFSLPFSSFFIPIVIEVNQTPQYQLSFSFLLSAFQCKLPRHFILLRAAVSGIRLNLRFPFQLSLSHSCSFSFLATCHLLLVLSTIHGETRS